MRGKRSGRGAVLLRDGGLVAYGLPVAGAADQDARVAVGAAEVFAELVSLHVGAGCHDGGVAVDAHHHVTDIDGFIAELAALAGGDGVLLGRDLSQRGDGNVILSEGALGEVGIAVEAGFLGLPLHFHDLFNRGLVSGVDRRPRMHRNMLAREDRQGYEQRQQQHCTLVEHDETSAVCEGTEIRLTELRNLGCWSSVEKLSAATFVSTSTTGEQNVSSHGRTSFSKNKDGARGCIVSWKIPKAPCRPSFQPEAARPTSTTPSYSNSASKRRTRQILEIRNQPGRGTAPIVHSGTGVSSIGQESFRAGRGAIDRYRRGRMTREGQHLVESNLRFMHG